MAAHDNLTFLASNRIWVGFRSRYQGVSCFNLSGPDGRIIRIARDDGGKVWAMSEDDAIRPEHTQALAEYDEDERRKYEQWRKDNAHLFAS